MHDTAHAVAGRLADIFIDGVAGRGKGLDTSGMRGTLVEGLGFSEHEASGLADRLLLAAVGFVDGACSNCHVACLARPKARLSREFFSDTHPALS